MTHVRLDNYFESVDASGEVAGNNSAGDERGDLLAKLRVLQQQRVLATLELLLLLLLLLRRRRRLLRQRQLLVLRLMKVLMLLMLMLMVLLLRYNLRFGLGALIQHADGTVLADPVRHFRRIDPHGELAGEEVVENGRQQANVRARLSDHRVHFAVDADATVAGATVRPVREPVVAVAMAQHLRQRRLEHLQLPLRQLARLQAQQVHQKIRRRNDFQSHT